MSVLEFTDVHRSFQRGADVLAGIDFSVDRGEVIGLLGKNGAGKTTAIRLALGLIAADRGTVRAFDLDPRRRPLDVKRRVGYVAEDQILPHFLSVGRVIALHRDLFPTWDTEMERELLARFELPLETRVGSLSKGQARQTALLCAVCHRPELLLLDEPAGGLDPAARREFLETSIRLLNEAGTTIVFSSHYMSDVERLAGRILMLHEGRVLIDDDLDTLREAFSVVRLPRASGVPRPELRRLEGCLGARERGDALHAVFRRPAEAARGQIEAAFGACDAQCRSVDLEEMFIELAGGQR